MGFGYCNFQARSHVCVKTISALLVMRFAELWLLKDLLEWELLQCWYPNVAAHRSALNGFSDIIYFYPKASNLTVLLAARYKCEYPRVLCQLSRIISNHVMISSPRGQASALACWHLHPHVKIFLVNFIFQSHVEHLTGVSGQPSV